MVQVEKKPEIKWLEKEKYQGQTIECLLVKVSELQQDLRLDIEIKDIVYSIRTNKQMFNGLIELYGKDTDEWEGQIIKLKFEEFKPDKPGSDISEGTKTTLVMPEPVEEETIITEDE